MRNKPITNSEKFAHPFFFAFEIKSITRQGIKKIRRENEKKTAMNEAHTTQYLVYCRRQLI